jgi:hypothetical protein
MSLMRLLSAGKSWVGMTDNAGRYQVTRQRLLPKFGGAPNPFQPAVGAAEPGAITDPAATPTAGEVPAANLSETQVIPELASQPVPASQVAAPVQNWWRRILGVFRWRGRGFAAASARAPRPAVQGELTLEGVKVVRNDLSDADLELVPAKAKAKAATPAVTPTLGTAPAAASAKADRWRQAANRLVGIGRG